MTLSYCLVSFLSILFRAMPNMSGYTVRNYHDSVYPSQCKLQRFFNPRSTSMYESVPPRGRYSEPLLPRSRSNQSFDAYKRLPSPVQGLVKPRSYKARLPLEKGLRAHHRPSRNRTMTVSRRELKPTSKAHIPAAKNNAPFEELTSHRISNTYLRRRSLSPSFLDLSDSPDYDPPSATSLSTTNPTSRVKRKGKPPPLILRESFHFPDSQSPALPIPPNDAKAAPLTPMTPFTPVSPRYRMPSEKEQFRRRLLKLQRTLGEQITPGLVVRPKPHSKTTVDELDDYKGETTLIKLHPRGEASFNAAFDDFPTSTLCAPPALDSNFLENMPFTHKMKRDYLPETVALSPMTLTAFTGPPVTPKSVTSKGSSLQFVLNYGIQESSSENDDYDTPPVSSLDDSYPPSLFDGSYPSSPVQFDHKHYTDGVNPIILDAPHLVLNRTELPSTPTTPGIKRKERRHGWSGEWNRPHIQDVIEKLRIL